MSGHGGKRAGAGRKPGSTTRFQRDQVEKAKEGGLMPLDFMLEVMRNENNPTDLRRAAAKSAAPFVHSKMPTAIVTPAQPAGPMAEDDERLLNLYLTGLHDGANEE